MITPPNLRGRFYPTEEDLNCKDYSFCSVLGRCRNFSIHRVKCLVCETGCPINEGESYEDQDMKLMQMHLNKTSMHTQVAQFMEQKTGNCIFGTGKIFDAPNFEGEPETKAQFES